MNMRGAGPVKQLEAELGIFLMSLPLYRNDALVEFLLATSIGASSGLGQSLRNPSS